MGMPIGLVLAGGLGRRMGRPKGEMILGGSTLGARAAGVLAPLCRGVLVSVRRGGANPAPGFAAIEDLPPPGRGPLAGIDAAFESAGAADLLVLACDYPRVDTALLRRIVELAGEADDVVFPVDGKRRDHPLCGLWRASTASAVRRALVGGCYEVRALLSCCRIHRLPPDCFLGFDLDRLLLNLNHRGQI